MIYFDNAATTPLDEIAIDALKEYGVEKFFNPSALYREALENTKTLNAARENILKIMHGDGDFIFTASGTEADNMAIYGVKKPKNAPFRRYHIPSIRGRKKPQSARAAGVSRPFDIRKG